MNNWYAYIAITPTGRYYTGITTDTNRRILEHNKGQGAKIARDTGNLRLQYVSKPFNSQSQARKREVQIKGWRKDKKLKLISGEWT